MKLQRIQIRNYRSIEDLVFEVTKLLDNSYTYGLIGVNEAGKSSILNAIALKELKDDGTGLLAVSSKDFRDEKPVEVLFYYHSDEQELESSIKSVLEGLDPSVASDGIDFSEIIVKVTINYANPEQRNFNVAIPKAIKEKDLIEKTLTPIILGKLHKSIFWTAEDRYLISQPINLEQFASTPESISIPLKNCFSLAGISTITEIQERIRKISDTTELELLQEELGENVTKHIKSVWPEHPISISFVITNGQISFHVKDEGVKSKAKTVNQRSDGFKQFISFLLTISAQDRNSDLSNAILLLDEPETHLHPEAQEYLLGDLIKITKNKRNNIVFFATHSVFMIDKEDLSRNFRIVKEGEKTKKIQFDKKSSTYGSITYEVFDIPGLDYHNELYSKVHQIYQEEDLNDKDRAHILTFDTNFLCAKKRFPKTFLWMQKKNGCTLPTYIRNCMHHPDNGNKYSRAELKKSIELLRALL